MAGVPSSDGCSGVVAGGRPDPFSGRGADGTTSAPAANMLGGADMTSHTIIATTALFTICSPYVSKTEDVHKLQ
jgi:hypothetical protein